MPKTSNAIVSTPRIVVDNVRKGFTLRHTHSFKETFLASIRRRPISTQFNALDGVSFTVNEGEAVALLGFNGSGKSTLLKLISGVLTPDGGRLLTRGRVAGMIEVGAGFHPDLSGRENIYLNAAILGMSKAETDRRFDDIVAFSEIEKFIDTEVKHYSSGMFLRLAFSVAIHTEQDVLLIDEILSVGDEPFQKKCLARIRELHAAGKTLVVVSHDLGLVTSLCDRGIVLNSGRVEFDSDAVSAVKHLRRIGWSPFVDVPHDHPLLAEIVEAVKLGVMSGVDAGDDQKLFSPRRAATVSDVTSALAVLGHRSDVLGGLSLGDDVTRAQLAQVLYSAASSDLAVSDGPAFADVPTTHTAYSAIAWMAGAGIARGWSEGGRLPAFQPDAPVTREALAVFLARLHARSN